MIRKKTIWTVEAIKTLREMWANGATSSAIGYTLGFDGGVVLRKVKHLDLPRRSAESKSALCRLAALSRRQKEKPKPKMASKKGLSRAEIILRNANFLKNVEPFEETVLDIECRNVSLLELKMLGMCRWPLGDVRAGGVTYCGNDCNVKDSYCAPHKALAYRPVAVLA